MRPVEIHVEDCGRKWDPSRPVPVDGPYPSIDGQLFTCGGGGALISDPSQDNTINPDPSVPFYAKRKRPSSLRLGPTASANKRPELAITPAKKSSAATDLKGIVSAT